MEGRVTNGQALFISKDDFDGKLVKIFPPIAWKNNGNDDVNRNSINSNDGANYYHLFTTHPPPSIINNDIFPWIWASLSLIIVRATQCLMLRLLFQSDSRTEIRSGISCVVHCLFIVCLLGGSTHSFKNGSLCCVFPSPNNRSECIWLMVLVLTFNTHTQTHTDTHMHTHLYTKV